MIAIEGAEPVLFSALLLNWREYGWAYLALLVLGDLFSLSVLREIDRLR